MGEVYRATDTKLGREVALKVLPAGMAASADRLERFRREAKVLAAETAWSLQGDTLVLTHEGHSLARFAAGEAK